MGCKAVKNVAAQVVRNGRAVRTVRNWHDTSGVCALPLRQAAGQWLRGALATEPVYGLLRARARAPGAIPILMYHTLGPDAGRLDAWTVLRQSDFLAQVRALREHHDIVSLDDALEPGPGRPRAVITFDDGNASLVSHLLPLLDRERLPVTVYVATRHVETGQPYWFDALVSALQPPCARVFDLGAWGLGRFPIGDADPGRNWLRISALLEAMKTLTPDEREQASAAVLRQSGDSARSARQDDPLRPLTPTELKRLADSPWVTIGSHTHGHELLDQIPLDEALLSIDASCERLQAWTGKPVRHFAYPNGNSSVELVEALRRRGQFDSAVTTRPARCSARSDRLALPRIGVGRFDSLARFRLSLLVAEDVGPVQG